MVSTSFGDQRTSWTLYFLEKRHSGVDILCCPRLLECTFNFVVSGNLGNHHCPALDFFICTRYSYIPHRVTRITLVPIKCLHTVLVHITQYILLPQYLAVLLGRHYKACRPWGVLRKKI